VCFSASCCSTLARKVFRCSMETDFPYSACCKYVRNDCLRLFSGSLAEISSIDLNPEIGVLAFEATWLVGSK